MRKKLNPHFPRALASLVSNRASAFALFNLLFKIGVNVSANLIVPRFFLTGRN